jgi:hypothetical protein
VTSKRSTLPEAFSRIDLPVLLYWHRGDVVVLAGTVAAEPVERRMSSSDVGWKLVSTPWTGAAGLGTQRRLVRIGAHSEHSGEKKAKRRIAEIDGVLVPGFMQPTAMVLPVLGLDRRVGSEEGFRGGSMVAPGPRRRLLLETPRDVRSSREEGMCSPAAHLLGSCRCACS